MCHLMAVDALAAHPTIANSLMSTMMIPTFNWVLSSCKRVAQFAYFNCKLKKAQHNDTIPWTLLLLSKSFAVCFLVLTYITSPTSRIWLSMISKDNVFCNVPTREKNSLLDCTMLKATRIFCQQSLWPPLPPRPFSDGGGEAIGQTCRDFWQWSQKSISWIMTGQAFTTLTFSNLLNVTSTFQIWCIQNRIHWAICISVRNRKQMNNCWPFNRSTLNSTSTWT